MSLNVNTRPLTLAERLEILERAQREHSAALAQAIAQGSSEAVRQALQAIEINRIEMQREISRLEKEMSGQMGDQADFLRKQLQNIRENISRTSEGLDKEIKDLSRTLNKKMDKNFKDISKSLRDLDKAMNKRIDSVNKSVSSLRKDVDGILDKMKKEQKQASEIIAEAASFLRNVERRSPVVRFTPAEFERITSDLKAIAGMDIPDASVIALVEKIILDTARMENDAVALKLKHDALLSLVGGLISSLETVMKENSKMEVTSKGRTGKVDTAEWTRGESAKIEERLSELGSIISSDKNPDGIPLSDEDVLKIQDEVSALSKEASEAFDGAVAKVLDAWDRIDILGKVAACQSDMGHVIKVENGKKAMGSFGGDIMNGSFVIMEDTLTGESTTFIVVPGPDGSPQLVTQNNMEGATDEQIALNTERIRRSLSEKGIGMPSGNGTCLGHTPLPELGSSSSLGSKESAEALRKRMASNHK